MSICNSDSVWTFHVGNEQIDGKSVGFGGSITLDEMGLYEGLGTHNKVWWHWKGTDGLTSTIYGHENVYFVVEEKKLRISRIS